MKRSMLRDVGFPFSLVLVLLSVLTLSPAVQATDRYLDDASVRDASVRLVVFNPEAFNICALDTLRKNGTLDVPNLTVVGIYHFRQTGNFADSRKYVADNGLDWFKFHEVSADVDETSLFRKNAWTSEFELVVEKADGVVFFGGPDIPPAVFGEKTSLLTQISDPYRHWFEASAAFHLLGGFQDEKFVPLLESRPDFPVLGICLGQQTLNVGAGGSLVQDIWSEVYAKATVEDVLALGDEQWHNNPFRRIHPQDQLIGYNFHTIELDIQSLFVKAMGFKRADHPRVLSSHHQAVGKLGKGLFVAAWSRDKRVVEAVQHKKFSGVLGVQFHPEHPLLFDAEPLHRVNRADGLTSFRSILEGTPPSLEFNRAVWAWFGTRLVAGRGR